MCVTCSAGYSNIAESTGYYSCEKDPISEKKDILSSGAIAGILVGVIVALGIIGGLTAYYIYKSNKKKVNTQR